MLSRVLTACSLTLNTSVEEEGTGLAREEESAVVWMERLETATVDRETRGEAVRSSEGSNFLVAKDTILIEVGYVKGGEGQTTTTENAPAAATFPTSTFSAEKFKNCSYIGGE